MLKLGQLFKAAVNQEHVSNQGPVKIYMSDS